LRGVVAKDGFEPGTHALDPVPENEVCLIALVAQVGQLVCQVGQRFVDRTGPVDVHGQRTGIQGAKRQLVVGLALGVQDAFGLFVHIRRVNTFRHFISV